MDVHLLLFIHICVYTYFYSRWLVRIPVCSFSWWNFLSFCFSISLRLSPRMLVWNLRVARNQQNVKLYVSSANVRDCSPPWSKTNLKLVHSDRDEKMPFYIVLQISSTKSSSFLHENRKKKQWYSSTFWRTFQKYSNVAHHREARIDFYWKSCSCRRKIQLQWILNIRSDLFFYNDQNYDDLMNIFCPFFLDIKRPDAAWRT